MPTPGLAGDAAAERQRAVDMLDAQEASGPVPLLDEEGTLMALRDARRIAIVGASPDELRSSNSVMRYLMEHGYECVPVNPNAPEVLGQPCFATLEEAAGATGTFDIVDVFRRSQHTPEVARSAVAVGAKVLWLQLGVVSWEAARIATEGGLGVVMDRCTAIDHRRLRMEQRP